MTLIELKQVILDYIILEYECEYVGKINIEKLNPDGYKVSFYLDNSENPIAIISDLSENDFIEFIKKELKSRKFHKVKHYKAVKIPQQTYNYCNG